MNVLMQTDQLRRSEQLEKIADCKHQRLGKIASWNLLKDELKDWTYKEFAEAYKAVSVVSQEYYEKSDLVANLGVSAAWIDRNANELHCFSVGKWLFIGASALKRFILNYPGEIVPYQQSVDLLWLLTILGAK